MSKHWMFTSFEEQPPRPNVEKVEYMIYQQEMCPETSKLHWQGYCVLKTRSRMETVKKLLGSPSIHLEVRKGTLQQAIDYCRKLSTRVKEPVEVGVRPKEEKVNIVEELKKKRPLEILEENPQLWRGLKQMRELRSCLTPPRSFMTDGIFLNGLTGTGKSKICSVIGGFLGSDEVYWAEPELKWFDNYDGQKLVIVDEFRGNVNPSTILRLIDRYPLRCPIKGGYTQWAPAMVIFTSNLEFKDIFPEDVATKQALQRRLKIHTVY